MVKVLQIDLFEKGGILPLTSVPIAVTATADFVLVAFANGTITRYDATEGKVGILACGLLVTPLPRPSFLPSWTRPTEFVWFHTFLTLSTLEGTVKFQNPRYCHCHRVLRGVGRALHTRARRTVRHTRITRVAPGYLPWDSLSRLPPHQGGYY